MLLNNYSYYKNIIIVARILFYFSLLFFWGRGAKVFCKDGVGRDVGEGDWTVVFGSIAVVIFLVFGEFSLNNTHVFADFDTFCQSSKR